MKDPLYKDLVDARTDKEYKAYVKRPMCLNDIDIKNTNEAYTDLDAVKEDLDLIRDNALAVSKNPAMDPKQRKDLCHMIDSFENFCLLKLDQIDKIVIQGCAKALKRREQQTAAKSSPRPAVRAADHPASDAIPAEARNDDMSP